MARSFYCNHCGKKVSSHAAKCPSCGRYFGAVLCPQCGYSGEDKEFSSGCPVCGYLGDKVGDESVRTLKEKKKRPLLDLPLPFFVLGILLLSGLLLFLINLWL
jgi:predicted amidophosphoribosyltransferase